VKTGSCRIIGGNWRGRKIKFDDAAALRPTTDRIRETVFNWLQPYVYQSICLDLFAGSGVLGFEALSRGAAEVVFIESNKTTVSSIKKNIAQLKVSEVAIYNEDALRWLSTTTKNPCFNLVFLDPPFHSDLLVKSSIVLNDSGILADDAIIYVEHEGEAEFSAPDNWSCIKDKRAGQVNYKLFELI
jgi:16S rRNA (guanine966-N2)-methyltransferase